MNGGKTGKTGASGEKFTAGNSGLYAKLDIIAAWSCIDNRAAYGLNAGGLGMLGLEGVTGEYAGTSRTLGFEEVKG